MKLSTAFLGLLAFFSINTQFAQPGCVNGSCSALMHGPQSKNDIASELQALETPSMQQDDSDDSDLGLLVLSNFFGKILQGFLTIIQNPHNPKVIGAGLSGMVAGFAEIASQISKKTPNMSEEEYIEYLSNLETNLRTCLRSIVIAKRQHKILA